MTTIAPPQPTTTTPASTQPLSSGIAREKDPVTGLPAPINAFPGYALGFAIGMIGVVVTLVLI